MTAQNKKQPRKGLQERRDRILKAAIEVFTEKGVNRATVDDIATRAGVGKGTIYRRAGKKANLIKLLADKMAQLFTDDIKSGIKKRTDPLLQLKEVINVLCDVYEKNSDLVMLMYSHSLFDIRHTKQKGDKHSIAFWNVHRLLKNILQRAIKKGQIRVIDTEAVMKGFSYFFNPFFYYYLRFNRNYTKGEIVKLMIDWFLDGLRIKK